MKWQGRKQSANVTDKRGVSGGKIALGGGVGGIVVIGLFLLQLFAPSCDTSMIRSVVEIVSNSNMLGSVEDTTSAPLTEEETEDLEFVTVILAGTEEAWTTIFAENGLTYEPVDLVLFSGSTVTKSGSVASAQTGPFYAPNEQTIYVDLSFFQELKHNYGADVQDDIAEESGDFVVAYVIAHEVGHHVQNLLGTLDEVAQVQGSLSETEANEWSVACELQADYYAGVYANFERQTYDSLEAGDIAAAILAAKSIGDDAIQEKAYGSFDPHSFTHGSSEQRADWFGRGLESGNIAALSISDSRVGDDHFVADGDTFAALGLE